MLYPIKFIPRLKEKVWGGKELVQAGKRVAAKQNPDKIGESWEVSGVEGDESVVVGGFLKGNNLSELTEVYMGELVGDKVYEKYGLEFPVLLKFIDACDTLSVQVHPTGQEAKERHNARGKTEVWYIVDAEPDGAIYLGFNKEVTKEEYLTAVESDKIEGLLQKMSVCKGDTFFIPAGTIHSIGKGVMIAEIEETSDITYRIYDWGRVDKEGNPRELHTEFAAQSINFEQSDNLNITKTPVPNSLEELVSCEHFTTNLINLGGTIDRDYAPWDSFVAYMCVEGEFEMSCDGEREKVSYLETILVPAEKNDVTLTGEAKILEIYIK